MYASRVSTCSYKYSRASSYVLDILSTNFLISQCTSNNADDVAQQPPCEYSIHVQRKLILYQCQLSPRVPPCFPFDARTPFLRFALRRLALANIAHTLLTLCLPRCESSPSISTLQRAPSLRASLNQFTAPSDITTSHHCGIARLTQRHVLPRQLWPPLRGCCYLSTLPRQEVVVARHCPHRTTVCGPTALLLSKTTRFQENDPEPRHILMHNTTKTRSTTAFRATRSQARRVPPLHFPSGLAVVIAAAKVAFGNLQEYRQRGQHLRAVA